MLVVEDSDIITQTDVVVNALKHSKQKVQLRVILKVLMMHLAMQSRQLNSILNI